SLDLNNALCQWRPDAAKQHVGHLFARQAISMVWDYAEANPFGPSAGGYEKTIIFIPKALEEMAAECQIGIASQVDATQVVSSKAIISTDPPYYDNVGYADLSDFFYVWLRRTVRDIYPDIFGTM